MRHCEAGTPKLVYQATVACQRGSRVPGAIFRAASPSTEAFWLRIPSWKSADARHATFPSHGTLPSGQAS